MPDSNSTLEINTLTQDSGSISLDSNSGSQSSLSESVLSQTSGSISVSTSADDLSTLLPDDLKLSQTGESYYSRLDSISAPDFTIGASGDRKLIFGGSVFPVTGGQTVYMGSSVDPTEANARISLIQCTVKQVQVSSSVAPGTGESFTYTLMKNGTADSTFVVTAENSNQSGSISDSTGLAFSNGDFISLRLVTSSGASSAHHSFSIKID